MRHLIIILFCVFASAVQAQLTGKNREDYIAGHFRSCSEFLRENPSNSNIADVQINSYCSCKATYLADHANEQQLLEAAESIEKTGVVPEVLKRLNEQANSSCIGKLNQAVNPRVTHAGAAEAMLHY